MFTWLPTTPTAPPTEGTGGEHTDTTQSTNPTAEKVAASLAPVSAWFSSVSQNATKIIAEVKEKVETAAHTGEKEGETVTPQQKAAALGQSFVTGLSGIATTLKTKVEKELDGWEAERKRVEEQRGANDQGVPPWEGIDDGGQIKAQILALSSDKRNFLMAPPPGTQFVFSFGDYVATAMATMREDPALKDMRFNLVPKLVNEDTFWRNYFYRVSLIKQQTHLASLLDSHTPQQHTTTPQQDPTTLAPPKPKKLGTGDEGDGSEFASEDVTSVAKSSPAPTQPATPKQASPSPPTKGGALSDDDPDLDDLEDELQDMDVASADIDELEADLDDL